MGFNPFHSNSEGSSFEEGNPINAGLKKKAQDAGGQASQQAKAANQTFVDQLYGNVSSASPETLDPSGDPAQAASQMQKASAASPSGPMPAANPGEQSKLDETRQKLMELQKQHKETYFEATFGAEAQQKRREREEEELQLKQEEEEQQQQEEEEKKARMEESMQSFQSHGKNGKGPDKLGAPVAVTQAKTKTEINRGSSG